MVNLFLAALFALVLAAAGVVRAADAPTTPGLDAASLQPRADRGDAEAQRDLAECYYWGRGGVARDLGKAFAWTLKAAEQGDVRAEINLGALYRDGTGVKADRKQALQWYLKAAQQGNAEAAAAVADAYAKGWGGEPDPAEAFRWYETAASAGNEGARTVVAFDYLNGVGVAKDEEKGFTNMLFAIGNDPQAGPYAAMMVARCYASGTFVAKDPVEAYRWCLVSRLLGGYDGLDTLETSLKAQLQPAQIAQAWRLVHDYIDIKDHAVQTSALRYAIDADAQRVPFVVRHGEILVPITLPNVEGPRYLMLDTCSPTSFMTPELAEKTGATMCALLPFAGIERKPDLTKLVAMPDLRVGNVRFHAARFCVSASASAHLSESLGGDVVGIFGFDLLHYFCLDVRFSDNTLLLAPPSVPAPGGAQVEAIPFAMINGWPEVIAQVSNNGASSRPEPFRLDTGNGGPVDLTVSFLAENRDLELHSVGVCGESGLVGALRLGLTAGTSFKLGSFVLAHPVFSIPEGGTVPINGEDGGVIGWDVWRRFDLYFDFPRYTLYLQRNKFYDEPFRYSTVAMQVAHDPAPDGGLEVITVVPGGRAAEAGFVAGDEIVSITGAASTTLTGDEWSKLAATPGTYKIKVRRQGSVVELTLHVTSFEEDAAATEARTHDR